MENLNGNFITTPTTVIILFFYQGKISKHPMWQLLKKVRSTSSGFIFLK